MTFISQITAAQCLVVGASRGIGLGFVRQLLQESWCDRIIALCRRPDSALELQGLRAQYPQKLICVACDVTQETAIQTAIAQLGPQLSRLHLVINCVGVLHSGQISPEKSLKHINGPQLQQYFLSNTIPTALLAKHLTPFLKHDEPSIFAAISAKVGSVGDNRLGGWYGYRASKAALNMLLKNVAIEYGRISPKTTVVSLHPGTTDTDLSKPFQSHVPPGKLFPVAKTVGLLLDILKNLTPQDSGKFFSWDGQELPW